jgi:hypothetical protein
MLDHPNPQRPDPFAPKMPLKEWCDRYGVSLTTGLRYVRQNRIPAEQPGGPGTSWYVLLDRREDEDNFGEAALLQEIRETHDGTQAA